MSPGDASIQDVHLGGVHPSGFHPGMGRIHLGFILDAPPPMSRMTHAGENITFPIFRMRAVCNKTKDTKGNIVLLITAEKLECFTAA